MYRVPVLERFAWQEPVLAVADAPTQSTKGSRYIVGAGASGDFAGHAGAIAWHDGTQWMFDNASEGMRAYNKSDANYYTFDGTSWQSSNNLDGFTLTGDIDSTNYAVDWDLKENDAEALSFDTTSMQGILRIDTTTGAEQVAMGGDLLVAGNLTVQGETTVIETATLSVEDKLITVNRGGAVDSGANSGLEVEEDGTITGFNKVDDVDRSIWTIKAPGGSVLDLDINADSTLEMAGNLHVEAESWINQDVTTDGAPQFSGGVNLVAGNLTSTGSFTDGSNSVTALEAKTAYDRRARWDADLGVIYFDNVTD